MVRYITVEGEYDMPLITNDVPLEKNNTYIR